MPSPLPCNLLPFHRADNVGLELKREDEYQVRGTHEEDGSIRFFATLEEAINFAKLRGFSKISWTVGNSNRIILRSDGTWETW